MHFHTSLVYLATLTSLTTAYLLPFNSTACATGNAGAVYYCPRANFTNTDNTCIYRMPNQNATCFTPTVVPQSIGPDQGGHCLLYEDGECRGKIINPFGEKISNKLTCPGVREWPGDMPRVGSIKCLPDGKG